MKILKKSKKQKQLLKSRNFGCGNNCGSQCIQKGENADASNTPK